MVSSFGNGCEKGVAGRFRSNLQIMGQLHQEYLASLYAAPVIAA